MHAAAVPLLPLVWLTLILVVVLLCVISEMKQRHSFRRPCVRSCRSWPVSGPFFLTQMTHLVHMPSVVARALARMRRAVTVPLVPLTWLLPVLVAYLLCVMIKRNPRLPMRRLCVRCCRYQRGNGPLFHTLTPYLVHLLSVVAVRVARRRRHPRLRLRCASRHPSRAVAALLIPSLWLVRVLLLVLLRVILKGMEQRRTHRFARQATGRPRRRLASFTDVSSRRVTRCRPQLLVYRFGPVLPMTRVLVMTQTVSPRTPTSIASRASKRAATKKQPLVIAPLPWDVRTPIGPYRASMRAATVNKQLYIALWTWDVRPLIGPNRASM